MDLLKKSPRQFGQLENPGNLINPTVNFIDNGQKYIIEIMAPGMGFQDFDISVEDYCLQVTAIQNESEDEQYFNDVLPPAKIYFSRSISLPLDIIDVRNYGSYFNHGILKIVFSKASLKGNLAKYDLIKLN